MAWPTSLDSALKEWAAVIRALETGRQILLLRKGGILEQSNKNRFDIKYNEFLFFPTYLHQSRGELKPEAHENLEPVATEPAQVSITAAGVVTDIIKVQSREQIDRIDAHHIWTGSLIDMRFNYKPQNPLYLVLIRAYRLHQPMMLANTPEYAGCKSWVPLEQSVATGGALPVLDDLKYEHLRQLLLAALNAHPS